MDKENTIYEMFPNVSNAKMQLYRVDAGGKNSNIKRFIEYSSNWFDKRMVVILGKTYDNSKAERKTISDAHYYLRFADALLLAHDVLSGRIAMLAKQDKAAVKKGIRKNHEYLFFKEGGTSAEKLMLQGRPRADGKGEYRNFYIRAGDSADFVITIENGAGKPGAEENSTIRDYAKPDISFNLGITAEDLKKTMLVLQSNINAYLSATYVNIALAKQLNNLQSVHKSDYIENKDDSNEDEEIRKFFSGDLHLDSSTKNSFNDLGVELF